MNSVFSSTTNKLKFIESNTSVAEIRQHLIEGRIFEDLDKMDAIRKMAIKLYQEYKFSYMMVKIILF